MTIVGRSTLQAPITKDGVVLSHILLHKDYLSIPVSYTHLDVYKRQAYTGEKLNIQLTAAAESFLADKTKNEIAPDKIVLSKIFDWFGGDFKNKGSLIDFLNLYSKVKINSKAKISYMEYNWALNGI